MPMRIALAVEGGIAAFPGLARPVTLDCATLPPAQAARLRELVDAARFFSAAVPPAQTHPDARSYTVEIRDGAQARTLRLSEPIADASLRELVAEIRACVKGERRSGA